MPERKCSVDGCDRPHHARGLCWKHYDRWRRYGSPLAARPNRAVILVRGDDDHWLCTCLDDAGYGQFWVGGTTVRAHRIVYEDFVGPIPDGFEIDHICRVKACANFRHLRLVTRKQNEENHSGPQRNNTSGVRGVSWNKRRGKWHASVGHNYKSVHVGYFDSLAEAEAAVIVMRNKLFTHNDGDRFRPL
jgi:hypothetical protein